MPTEPREKRTVTFIDGQNLYYSVKEAFGYTFPNYDILALSRLVCEQEGWQLSEARFYTGVPDRLDNPRWHDFWSRKLLAMERSGVTVYSRPLRYRNKSFELPDGSMHAVRVADEKGIDVRLALDVIRLAHARVYDVAVVFSQDQDLSEVADEVRTVSKEQDRWIKIACAFPIGPALRNRRGINRTDWTRFDKETYETCIDRYDYRRKVT